MISINTLRNYFNVLGQAISAERTVYVVQDDHLQKKLRGEKGIFFCVVLPSASGQGSADNSSDRNTMMLFVIQFGNKSDTTDESELSDFASLQQKIVLIRNRIIEDADKQIMPMTYLDRSSIEIDPQWNIAGGYFGYSLTLSFIDNE